MYSPELTALLTKYGELLDQDLSAYTVYGSPLRPMSATWARIPEAVFMQTRPSQNGYHTYVAVPTPLEKTIINRYELVFISSGKEA